MNNNDQNIFKDLCKGETQQKIIKFIKKFINKEPLPEDFVILMSYLTKSYKRFSEFVKFVDCFDRNSKAFKIMLQLTAHINKHKNPKYIKYYKKIVKEKPARLIDGSISNKLILKSERK